MAVSNLPTTKAEQLVTADSELIKLNYITGNPRQFRFDASRGVFNINGTKSVTEKEGKPLSIIPVAYRLFYDEILGIKPNQWLELFFINEEKALCAILFHGFSVEEFKRSLVMAHYEYLVPCNSIITITPIKKTSTKPNAEGKNNTYFIASFEFSEADKTYLDYADQLTKGVSIYREETQKGTCIMQFWENYERTKLDELVASHQIPLEIAATSN